MEIFYVNRESKDEDRSGSDDQDEEKFYDSGYEYDEDDMISDSHVDHDSAMQENRAVIE